MERFIGVTSTGKALVSDMINGSDAINKMRDEIKFVVQTVTSLLTPDDLKTLGPIDERTGCLKGPDAFTPFVIKFTSTECLWYLYPGKIGSQPLFTDFDCLVLIREEPGSILKGDSLMSVLLNNGRLGHAQYTTEVYEALPVLLEGLVQIFPRLDKEMDWFRRAVKAYRSRIAA